MEQRNDDDQELIRCSVGVRELRDNLTLRSSPCQRAPRGEVREQQEDGGGQQYHCLKGPEGAYDVGRLHDPDRRERAMPINVGSSLLSARSRALLAVAAVGLGALAFERRDLGAPLLRLVRGPRARRAAPARLRAPWLRDAWLVDLRWQWLAMTLWAAATAAFVAVVVAVSPSVGEGGRRSGPSGESPDVRPARLHAVRRRAGPLHPRAHGGRGSPPAGAGGHAGRAGH